MYTSKLFVSTFTFIQKLLLLLLYVIKKFLYKMPIKYTHIINLFIYNKEAGYV